MNTNLIKYNEIGRHKSAFFLFNVEQSPPFKKTPRVARHSATLELKPVYAV
jgi:hypothetical protein